MFEVRGRIGAASRPAERAKAVISMLFDALTQPNAGHMDLRATKPVPPRTRQVADVQGKATMWGTLGAAELAVLLGWPVSGLNSLMYTPGGLYDDAS